MEALKTIMASKTRVAQCQRESRLLLLPRDLVGGAWQLRADDSGNICPEDLSACVPTDKIVAHWTLLMLEVNWDYHLASVRHMWKDNRQIEGCIQHLLKALHAIAILNQVHRNCAAMRPPTPTGYSAGMIDEPLVVWLAPTWQ
jgi:hypothetical protein